MSNCKFCGLPLLWEKNMNAPQCGAECKKPGVASSELSVSANATRTEIAKICHDEALSLLVGDDKPVFGRTLEQKDEAEEPYEYSVHDHGKKEGNGYSMLRYLIVVRTPNNFNEYAKCQSCGRYIMHRSDVPCYSSYVPKERCILCKTSSQRN